ncbi:unnamed protein product [Musa acuminata var. zebrina]
MWDDRSLFLESQRALHLLLFLHRRRHPTLDVVELRVRRRWHVQIERHVPRARPLRHVIAAGVVPLPTLPSLWHVLCHPALAPTETSSGTPREHRCTLPPPEAAVEALALVVEEPEAEVSLTPLLGFRWLALCPPRAW